MSKTINDIIEDFDSKVNVQEVSKSIEDENVESVQEEKVETPEAVEEGVENDKPEEQPVETEEVKEDAEPESEPNESVEKSETEPESEVAEEATESEVEEVEKSDKDSDKEDEEKKSSDDEDDKEDKKDKKDKKADKEDKEDKDEDKEDVKKSDESEDVENVEKSTISSQDIVGGFEAVFKNMANLFETQKSLTDTITELKSEIVSLREANQVAINAEEVNKSILVDKVDGVSVEGKAVGFVSKSVDVELDVTSEQEDVVEVVVEGAEQEEAPAKSDEEQLLDSVREIRDDLMSTYTRVASNGQAPRGELEEIRQMWGRIKSQDEIARAQAFIDKYK